MENGMIKTVLPYIGEFILKEMIEKEPDFLLKKFNIKKEDIKIHHQIELYHKDFIFDSMAKIDLGIEVNDSIIYPIEVKLGHTGLHKSNINEKLEKKLSFSNHKDMRVKGNMLAILNRNFDNKLKIPNNILHATINNNRYKISEKWIIIAFEHIISNWEKNKPDFNDKVIFIKFESLVNNFGKDKFNKLVQNKFINIDFYEKWIEEDYKKKK